jgi:hypothetical protein
LIPILILFQKLVELKPKLSTKIEFFWEMEEKLKLGSNCLGAEGMGILEDRID